MLNTFKLTVLSENRALKANLLAEQGLSFFIESQEDTILFDTGQTGSFIKNAWQLGIDLRRTGWVVLSHGHYDHVGGLPEFAERYAGPDVICHPALFNKKFKVIDGNRLEIGVPWEEQDLKKKGVNFIYKTHAFKIIPGIWFSGEIPRTTDYEYIDEKYQQKVKESFIHDEMHDDAALFINTNKGLVVVLGCGHAGPVNTIKAAMRVAGTKKIHAVIGGMHLHSCPTEKIEKIVSNIAKLNPDFVIPLHCTGFRAMNSLYALFRERLLLMNVGDSFTVNHQ